MHKFSLFYAISSVLFVFAFALLQSCEPEVIPTTEQRLPVEQNFKIWTGDDFEKAEVEPLDVSYHHPCQTACPDNITADDLVLIHQHHQKQMQRLVAGGK